MLKGCREGEGKERKGKERERRKGIKGSLAIILFYYLSVVAMVPAAVDGPVLLSSRKILVLEDPRRLIFNSLSLSSTTKSLSLSLSSDFKLLENFRGQHAFLKQSLCEHFQRKVVLEPFPYLTVYRCFGIRNHCLLYTSDAADE